jgi:hypothetical protein
MQLAAGRLKKGKISRNRRSAMHDPSATEQDPPKHGGKTARHNAGHAPGGSASVAQTPAPSGVDDNALEDHLRLVRRMSIGGLTARIDSIDRTFAVLVRP